MVVGKCELCKKEARIARHHIMPFWDDTINVCGRCHRKIERMTKNFLIYGMLKTAKFFDSRSQKGYKEKLKVKFITLVKSVGMQVRYNLNTGKVGLHFVYYYHYKGKTRCLYLGSASL